MRRQQRQHVARRRRSYQIKLIIIKLILAFLTRLYRIDQKRLHLLYREVHRQDTEPETLEIKRNRRRYDRYFTRRFIAGKRLPYDTASRVITLRLAGKPDIARSLGIERERLRRIFQRLSGDKKAAARHVQHTLSETPVVIGQAQHITEFKGSHQLVPGKGSVAGKKFVAVDKGIGNAVDRQRSSIVNLN